MFILEKQSEKMTKLKFIHAADLHLDTPFKGLLSWNEQLGSKLKDATFRSFRKIIDLCLQEEVDFLLISGDIFDVENKSLAAQIKFVSELKRLSDRGVPAYIVCGNHDPLSSWIDDLQMPKNVHRFDSSEVKSVTYNKNGTPIADIYGISYRDKVVNENLAVKYRLKDNPSKFSIALLHGTVGTPGRHENYAPFKIDDVEKKGFDYWALGHIHKRQIVKSSFPAIVYPGNPQGRDFGETGGKGCCLVEISENKAPEIKFITTQVINFEEVKADLTGEDKIDKLPELIDRAKENIVGYNINSSYILRITLKGRTSLHKHLSKPGEIEELVKIFNEGQLNREHFSWIDRIDFETQPNIDLEQLRGGSDFVSEILKMFDEYENSPDKLNSLLEIIETYMGSHQVKKELEKLTNNEKKDILDKAKLMLIDKLIEKE